MRRFTWLFCLLVLACNGPTSAPKNTNQDESPGAKDASKSTGPSIPLSLEKTDLIFRYLEKGVIKVVSKLEDVPKEHRHAVYVDDLSISPAMRQSERYLHRYDLSQPAPADTVYTNTPVLRSEVEAQIERMRPKPTATSKPEVSTPSTKAIEGAKVTLYSTQSCGYCRKARAFLTQNKVPFKERDIEKSPAARKELQVKAQRAGVRVNGVPVIDVNGQIIPGYNPKAILKALGG
jgi:glutaredoxin